MGVVKYLVRCLETACDPVWNSMAKIPWGTLSSAGDQSEYVGQLAKILSDIVPVILRTINEATMSRSFCDKLAEYVRLIFLTNVYSISSNLERKHRAIPAKMHSVVIKCRSICEVGAEQVSLQVLLVSEYRT
jgi:hypothetical protein